MTYDEARVIVAYVLTDTAVEALRALGLHRAAGAVLSGQPWPSIPEARRMQRRPTLRLVPPPEPGPWPSYCVSAHRASRPRPRRHVTFNTDRCAVCGAIRAGKWERRWCA